MRGTLWNRVFCVLVVSLMMAVASAPAQQPRPQQREDFSDYLPPGDGKALVAKECGTACHDLRGTIQLRKSRQAWEAIVLDMVARGAPLMVDDADKIIVYLSDAFGPKAPPLVDINTAATQDLVKLPGVTAAAADQLVAHRSGKGPLTSRDEVRTILGLEDRAFEKIKWYVRVGGR